MPDLQHNNCKTIDETIAQYKELSRIVFTSKSRNSNAAFDHDVFRLQIQKVVRNSRLGLSADAWLEDPRPDQERCRTFVVATRKHADGAVRLRTYGMEIADAFQARIWEAARATSAAPTFFCPIVINDVEYSDGGIGFNNPVKEAIAEVGWIWPNRPIGCLLSIGTGRESPLQLADQATVLPRMVRTILGKTSRRFAYGAAVAEYCVKVVTNCEQIHRELTERRNEFALNRNYFRLNVPIGMSQIGLDEWQELRTMMALTESYMCGEMLEQKQRIASLLLHPELPS